MTRQQAFECYLATRRREFTNWKDASGRYVQGIIQEEWELWQSLLEVGEINSISLDELDALIILFLLKTSKH